VFVPVTDEITDDEKVTDETGFSMTVSSSFNRSMTVLMAAATAGSLTL